jgi:hypothetical protein
MSPLLRDGLLGDEIRVMPLPLLAYEGVFRWNAGLPRSALVLGVRVEAHYSDGVRLAS